MGVGQFLKEGFHKHKASAFKIILSLVAVIVFLFAISAYNTSQNLKSQQALQSQKSVAAHTQTLDQIKVLTTQLNTAVTQLKNSNAADHTQTIKYINCVLVGVTGISSGINSQSQALTVYQTCLAENGAK